MGSPRRQDGRLFVETPGVDSLGHDAEHHAVLGHGASAPKTLEVGMVLVEKPCRERAALGGVDEELRPAAHRDAADVTTGSALGDDEKPWVTPQVPDFLRGFGAH